MSDTSNQEPSQPSTSIMSYDELKQRGIYFSVNRGENRDLQISQDDINILNRYKRNIFVYPTAIGAGLAALKFFTKNIEIPSFFDNPLEPDDRAIYRKKFFNKFFQSKILFIGLLGSFCYYYVRYEISKYYLYLKYENLVNGYVSARDSEYLKTFLDENAKQTKN